MRPVCPAAWLALFYLSIAAAYAGPSINGSPGLVRDHALEVAFIHPWRTVERVARSGQLTQLQNFIFNCNIEGRPTVDATASHGMVTFKDGVGTSCGKPGPVTELFYQSEAGFHGEDDVMVGAPFYVEIKVNVR